MSDENVGCRVGEPVDADLIAATRSGDTDAYGILYRRHVGAVKALARRLARDEAEAEDLVAETFTRVLALLRRGRGPYVAFRAYLHTALRRIKYDEARREQRHITSGEPKDFEPVVPFVDPAMECLERSLAARAFLSLPGRWQTVLWHTEIEEARPGDVAPLLGISSNAAAALACRARKGLRRAYQRIHLHGTALGQIGAVVASAGIDRGSSGTSLAFAARRQDADLLQVSRWVAQDLLTVIFGG